MAGSETNLCYLSIREASERLRRQELSPVELTRAHLQRIQEVDNQLHSFITVLEDRAMAEARAAEADILRGDYKGALHGIPIALKDLYDTAGVRTTSSSKVHIDRVPTEDATATARLKAAGIVLLGKLVMHEFALFGPDFTTPFAPARNPWNLAHVPGGSSSGSGAAVAAGLAMGALGTCTGGSIRIPASFCGIVGLKPTYGRVSRHGVVTLSWSQDHCGPMTRTVEDAALMLQAIAGYDPRDPTSSTARVPDYSLSLREDIKGLTIGVPRHFFFAPYPDANPEVLATVEVGLEALLELGANLEEVTLPSLEYVSAANSVIMLSEAYAFHEHDLKTRPQDFGQVARANLRIGGLFSASDYIQAQRCRQVLKREFAEALRRVDVIATPTMIRPAAAIQSGGPTRAIGGPNFTAPFNLTGLPAISVPCGFTTDGLPIGMQIAGKPFGESTVLRVGYAYQQYGRWFERRPPVQASPLLA